MFVHPAFATLAQRWKQPKCALTDRWVDKVQSICTVEYYSSLQRKEIVTHALTWMNVETIMVSNITQYQNDKQCAVPHI